MPYEGMTNQKVWVSVASGYRLPCPDTCSASVHGIMTHCWAADPHDRPEFATLLTFFRPKQEGLAPAMVKSGSKAATVTTTTTTTTTTKPTMTVADAEAAGNNPYIAMERKDGTLLRASQELDAADCASPTNKRRTVDFLSALAAVPEHDQEQLLGGKGGAGRLSAINEDGRAQPKTSYLVVTDKSDGESYGGSAMFVYDNNNTETAPSTVHMHYDNNSNETAPLTVHMQQYDNNNNNNNNAPRRKSSAFSNKVEPAYIEPNVQQHNGRFYSVRHPSLPGNNFAEPQIIRGGHSNPSAPPSPSAKSVCKELYEEPVPTTDGAYSAHPYEDIPDQGRRKSRKASLMLTNPAFDQYM